MLQQLGFLGFAIFVVPRLMELLPSFDPLMMLMGLVGFAAVLQHVAGVNLEREAAAGGAAGRPEPRQSNRREQQYQAKESPQASLDTLLSDAEKCIDQNNWDGARKRAQSAIDLDPESSRAWELLVTAHKLSGDKAAAKAAAEKATDIYEVDSAKLRTLRRELSETKPAAEVAAEHEARGEDFFTKKRFDLAVEWYSKGLEAIESAPSKAPDFRLRLLRRRCDCSQQLQDWSTCRADASSVLELEPQDQKALLQRAISLEALEKFKLALVDARALLAIDPKNTVANRIVHSCQRELQS